jgi:hypothetical protein
MTRTAILCRFCCSYVFAVVYNGDILHILYYSSVDTCNKCCTYVWCEGNSTITSKGLCISYTWYWSTCLTIISFRAKHVNSSNTPFYDSFYTSRACVMSIQPTALQNASLLFFSELKMAVQTDVINGIWQIRKRAFQAISKLLAYEDYIYIYLFIFYFLHIYWCVACWFPSHVACSNLVKEITLTTLQWLSSAFNWNSNEHISGEKKAWCR